MANSYILWLVLPTPVLSIHDLSTVRSGYGPLMKVSARSAGGQVCILHLARFNDFPGTKIVAIEPVQKTKPREKMVYFSLTAKLEWLTFSTAHGHCESAFALPQRLRRKNLNILLDKSGWSRDSRGRLHCERLRETRKDDTKKPANLVLTGLTGCF